MSKDPTTDFDALASEVMADPVAAKAANETTRRNGAKNSGFINWPVHLKNTGEGGMFVLAAVLDQGYRPPDYTRDSFVNCCGPGFSFAHSESLVGIRPKPPRSFLIENATENVTPLLLACVTLGTSGGSWYDTENEKLWNCVFTDLSAEGRDLVNSLSKLYGGRTVYLLTYLDT